MLYRHDNRESGPEARRLRIARGGLLLTAQQPPAFDVAVIKPADPSNTRVGIGFSPNGRTLTVDGLTAMQIIREAYGVFPDQLSSGPSLLNSGWTDSLKYDISAKAEGDTPLSKQQSNLMLQNLLADRFSLKTHRETREITVYSLVTTKSGPKFKVGVTTGPYLSAPAPGKFIGTKASMASLVRALCGQLHRPVIDDTGLTGAYDFTLTWAPGDIDAEAPSPAPTRPSLFTALQDQLGLRLASKKSPVEIIVIDHLEKPSAN